MSRQYHAVPTSAKISWKTRCKCAKLVPNLLPKVRYVLHCRNLKLYIKLGMTMLHDNVNLALSDVGSKMYAWARG